MPPMNKRLEAVGAIVGTAAFAVLLTAIVSGVWAGLLAANLASTPAIPWSAGAMAIVLWAIWSILGGKWGQTRSREARRALLRGSALSPSLFVWAVIAGVLWIAFLVGFWIVLHQLVATPSNPLPDFSKLPVATVLVSLVAASVAGAVSEEAGFRGYFQGTLERCGLGPSAIAVSALVMSPEHALTQGFVWPTLLFYLLVDGMLGSLAYLTKSILPGIVVHATGLLTFFAFVWPTDRDRSLVAIENADPGIWIEAAGAGVFALLSILAVRRVARLAR